MNVFGNRERGWRKARKRGVSPIIATILLVAITVVLAAVLYVLISGLTSGGANQVPIGTTFAFGAGSASQVTVAPSGATVCPGTITAGTCYTIAIGTAGGSATTGNIHFNVLKNGAGTSFTGVNVLSETGALLGTYKTGTGWTVVGSWNGALNSTQSLVIGNTASLSGSQLVAIGVGAVSGTSTPASLP